MPLVVPTPVPPYPPAPQPTDDRVTFGAKAFALAASYEPQRLAFNTVLDQVYINAQWAQAKALEAQQAASDADGFADAAHASRVAADQAVQDVRDALDAIEAGPVASVMGRTGVVTGLVETRTGAARNKSLLMANAPVGQWVAYYDFTGVGADWPPGHANTNWWNVFTFGSDELGQVTQRASQTLATPFQGWIYERQRDSAAWGPWQRVLTDRTLIESTAGGSISTSSYTLNPAVATVHQMGITASTTINLTAARTAGDQVTLCAHMQGSYTISLGANIALPIGASLPSVANGEMLMLIFTAKYDGTWYCAVAGKFPG